MDAAAIPACAADGASPLVDEARAVFDATVERAVRHFERGSPGESAVWAQIAAHFATYRHAGIYASDALEALLVEIARTLPPIRPAGSRARPGDSGRRRTLHVMTRALPVGGHTRAVERWVRSDEASVHALVATAQTEPLPPWLSRAVRGAGGFYESLALPPRDLLWRASRLRQVARDWADVVVLHGHPYDVVPSLAFGVDGGPPVLLFNHSDATFWLGARAADVVADMRETGRRLSLERRGISRSVVLPIPLVRREAPPREEARRRLQIPESATVLLTSGKDFKFVPFGDHDFFALAARILARRETAILLAVGLHDVRRWQSAADRRAPGRVRVFGPRAEIADFQAAADVYLDPMPATSLTAALEVGALGCPVVGFRDPVQPIFSSADDAAFAGLAGHARSPAEYERRADALIASAELRRSEGSAAAEAIRTVHMSPGWNRALECALDALPRRHRVASGGSYGTAGAGDRFLASFESAGDPGFGLSSCVAASSRYFDTRARAALFLEGLRGGEGSLHLPAKSHLPERWLVIGKRFLTTASSLGRRISHSASR
ncbi:MAG: hypothetical protein ABI592_12155 [Acidobacteriota bacterium]